MDIPALKSKVLQAFMNIVCNNFYIQIQCKQTQLTAYHGKIWNMSFIISCLFTVNKQLSDKSHIPYTFFILFIFKV